MGGVSPFLPLKPACLLPLQLNWKLKTNAGRAKSTWKKLFSAASLRILKWPLVMTVQANSFHWIVLCDKSMQSSCVCMSLIFWAHVFWDLPIWNQEHSFPFITSNRTSTQWVLKRGWMLRWMSHHESILLIYGNRSLCLAVKALRSLFQTCLWILFPFPLLHPISLNIVLFPHAHPRLSHFCNLL